MSRLGIMKGVVLGVACIALAGLSHAQSNFDYEKVFGHEKKYYLKDCMVKLNFRWPPAMTAFDWQRVIFDQQRVMEAMGVPIRKAMVSGEFSYFSGNFGGSATGNGRYFVFYFFDQCEHRRQFVQTFVEKYLVPNIPNFPDYQIEDQGLQPGFDGSRPQCCWLDDP